MPSHPPSHLVKVVRSSSRHSRLALGAAAALLGIAVSCGGDGTSPQGTGTAGSSGNPTSAGTSGATALGGGAGSSNVAGGGATSMAGTTPLGGADQAGEGGAPPEKLPGLCGDKDCDWVGVIGTGQSLSVGVQGGDLLQKTPEYHNLMLADAAPKPNFDYVNDPSGMSAMLSAVPLVDPMKPLSCSGPLPDCGFNTNPAITNGGYTNAIGDGYPNNIYGSTPAVAMADQITAFAIAAGKADYVTAQSVIGSSGKNMDYLRKGSTSGNSYAAAMYEAHAFAHLAKAAGKSFAYGAVHLTHGESDAGANMAADTYEAALARLQHDYTTDLSAITGQKREIPLIVSQQNTFPQNPGTMYTAPATIGFPTTAQSVWQAGLDYPGSIVCAGPKYQYEYAPDHVHLVGAGYVRLGEKYAEIYYRMVEEQKPWRPLQPKTATRTAADEITVAFDVPYPPLAWDDALKVHPTQGNAWASGRGFEVLDPGGNPVTISGVDLDAAKSQVVLHLTNAPTGRLLVQYAMSQDDVNAFAGGLDTGRRGQLRDSDPFVPHDQEQITCTVQSGSPDITACQKPLTPNHGITDLVVEASASITAFKSATDATLSAPVTGASGPRALTFHSNQYNYAVAFSMLVDDAQLKPAVDHDLNGDGKADIVWRNDQNGKVVAYLMKGTALDKAVDLPDVADQNWKLENTGSDFDKNGAADAIWRNYQSGAAQVWLMKDGAYVSKVDLPTVSDLNFHIETSGDFDHDGNPDIVWRNYQTGDVVLWLMNGTGCASMQGQLCAGTTLGFQVADANFRIRGAADVDLDGNIDIVWHNTASNALVMWYMQGTKLSRVVDFDAKAPAGSFLEEVTDLDGDGHADFVFRDPNGMTPVVWLLKRQQILLTKNLPMSDSTAWEIGSH